MGTSRWEALEARTPGLFLAAGVLLVIHAAIRGIRMFTEWPTPTDVFAPAGHVLALLGLLGIVHIVTPRTATAWRLRAVPVTLALLGWSGLTLIQVIEMLGLGPEQIPAWFGPFLFGVLVTGILAYAVVAVTCVREAGQPSRLGGLLSAPAGLFALLLLSVAIASPAVSGFVVGSGFVLTYIATGYVLVIDGGTAPQATAGDVPAG